MYSKDCKIFSKHNDHLAGETWLLYVGEQREEKKRETDRDRQRDREKKRGRQVDTHSL